jgi:hypothetical protein
MKNPYEECPQFEHCNCNACPLDSAINDKESMEGDGKCKVRKTTRIKIAFKYPELTMKGLNPREFRNKARWEAKSPTERQLILNRLGKGAKFIKKVAMEGCF